MWITEITTMMSVTRPDGHTVSLLKLSSRRTKAKYYAAIHKEPISDKFKEQLNGMPNDYAYMTEKQARNRFRLLVATPITIVDLSPAPIPKTLREIINESIS